jgi:LmbE family N-acetylglucosaminyl deacetylase
MATVLFFSPHQDDETLTMGASISNHVNFAHDVHVILATDGISSNARLQTPLSRTQFTKARDDEFRRACLALGVPAANIHISRFAAIDGQLTQARAVDVIMEYMEKFPGASVKTHTDKGAAIGQHPDHTNLGKAARQLLNAGVITDLRFKIEPYEINDFSSTGISWYIENTATPDKVKAALNEYKRVDTAQGMYGIGNLSVPAEINLVMSNPVSYVHRP